MFWRIKLGNCWPDCLLWYLSHWLLGLGWLDYEMKNIFWTHTCSLISGCTSRQWRHTGRHYRWWTKQTHGITTESKQTIKNRYCPGRYTIFVLHVQPAPELCIPVKLDGAGVVAQKPQPASLSHGQRVGRVVHGVRAEAPNCHMHCLCVQAAYWTVGEATSLACQISDLNLCTQTLYFTSSTTTKSSTSKFGCSVSLMLDLITRQL